MAKTGKIRVSTSRKVFLAVNNVILTLLMLSCILPFLYMVAVSFSNKTYVDAGMVSFLPKGFNVYAYQYLLKNVSFWRAFGVTVLVTVAGTALNLIMMILTAFPLSRPEGRLHGRTLYAWYFFCTMLVGGGMVPSYVLKTSLGLRNNLLVLFVPSALPVFSMILMINFFRQVPIEMEDSARIDGAGPLRTLLSIYVPLSKPSMASMALFSMVRHWNEWFTGMIYMSPKLQPLQTYLRTIIVQEDFSQLPVDESIMMGSISDATLRAAQIIIAMLPILCIYPFLQKYFVKGGTLGSVKG